MMSLTEVSFRQIIKKQFRYKVKAYLGVFSSLIILQLVAIAFSFNGVGMMGTGSNHYSITISTFSANMVIVFTMLWAVIISIMVTMKSYRNDDFSFVTNRLTSSLSTVVFLVVASIVAGMTAMLSSFLLKNIIYFLFSFEPITGSASAISIGEVLLGMVASSLYIVLFSSIGYFIGILVQWHRAFAISIPAMIFGLLFFGDQYMIGNPITWMGTFFFTESSFVLFACKILVISGVLFGSSIFISTRLEVRR
ncbi:hypothetical protein ACFFHM_19195 [Halalkalibacter kiskunsagensis]|uniref:ABC transporter permease n=1 Tax=Halalkalibacter kiskunsagensis TaxID=1548599 RepID=A0ABV6KGW4_9BACI